MQALLALSGVYKSMKKASQAKEKAEEARQLADDVQALVIGGVHLMTGWLQRPRPLKDTDF